MNRNNQIPPMMMAAVVPIISVMAATFTRNRRRSTPTRYTASITVRTSESVRVL